MTRKLIALAVLVALAGCANTPPEVRAARACENIGITIDDPRFDHCMDRMEMHRQANMAASAAMLGYGTRLLQPTPSMNLYVH